MAASTCPKCNGTQFDAAALQVRGRSLRPTAIQCATCGAIVGLVSDNSEAEKALGKTLAGMQKAITDLVKKTGK